VFAETQKAFRSNFWRRIPQEDFSPPFVHSRYQYATRILTDDERTALMEKIVASKPRVYVEQPIQKPPTVKPAKAVYRVPPVLPIAKPVFVPPKTEPPLTEEYLKSKVFGFLLVARLDGKLDHNAIEQAARMFGRIGNLSFFQRYDKAKVIADFVLSMSLNG
jgi:hypothetical protein